MRGELDNRPLSLRVPMVAAVDQHTADAEGAHFAEGDLLRSGRHGQRLVVPLPTLRPRAS
jgi:hypothetical protein